MSQIYKNTNKFKWHARLDTFDGKQFIMLYVFGPDDEPETYFIWLTDYQQLEYWLNYLYQFDEVRPLLLNVIYSNHFPDKLFRRCLAKLDKLKQKPTCNAYTSAA